MRNRLDPVSQDRNQGGIGAYGSACSEILKYSDLFMFPFSFSLSNPHIILQNSLGEPALSCLPTLTIIKKSSMAAALGRSCGAVGG